MGNKANPIGMRLGINKDWLSRWCVEPGSFASVLISDVNLRRFLDKKLSNAYVGRVETERNKENVRIRIFSSRPGLIIGKSGREIDILRDDIKRRFGFFVQISVEEIKKPELDACLVAKSVAAQIEGRVSFRKAMKKAAVSAMRAGAEGVKLRVAGRLDGAEIARKEWMRLGRVPLQTFRADIDYSLSEANTTYGVIGVKAWIFKGDASDSGS